MKVLFKNTGKVKGAEVVQLYIKDLESSVDRPGKELKRFTKVSLNPGEEKIVEFEIDEKALSFFDPVKKAWIAEPGEFDILIGGSSEEVKLIENFKLK